MGCDPRSRRKNSCRKRFNPRTRMGCDWLCTHHRTLVGRSFNPRTRMGCDLGECSTGWTSPRFQSAHPRRVRFHISLDCASGFGFQSAHPREMDKPPLSGTKHKILYPRQHEHILFFINHANAIISIRLPERVRADGKCRPIFGSLKNCGERPRPFSLPVPVRTICWPEHCPVRSRG